jgi:anti-sigma B factor antagonist
MATPPEASLHLNLAESTDKHHGKLTTITCRGRLVAGTADRLKELVKPLVEHRTHIVLDCAGLAHVDSAGLGALVALKVSAIHQTACTLELVHLSDRVLELLRLTHLNRLFSV